MNGRIDSKFLSPVQSKRALMKQEIIKRESSVNQTIDQLEFQSRLDEFKFEQFIQKLRTDKKSLREILK